MYIYARARMSFGASKHAGNGVLAESPFSTFEEVALYRVGRQTFPVAARSLVKLASLYSRSRYGLDLMRASPLAALCQSTTPVLLIHGTADVNIPPLESRELHAANPQSTALWEVEGAVHVRAMQADPREFQRRVLSWFTEH